ncbi:ATP synthase A1 subunit C [Candidatus Woesearchaeota archaeon]|nr:ATP synthase A1 subunit C [Candidatus Woesearchaeota archaeon]
MMLQGRYSAGKEGYALLGKGRRLRLGKYPYTYARTSFMRSFLLGKDDYNKLMKMDVNEMIGYLESSQYRKEIDEFAVQFKGVRLMELALNRNLANTWLKLKRISPPSLRVLIAMYLLRVDVWNLKTIVRAKYTKLSPEQLPPMLLPSGFMSEKNLSDLARKESVEDILSAANFVDFRYFTNALESFKATSSISEIENALDRFYCSAMREFSKRLPDEGRLFREFLESELEITTIINILRLKRANMAAKDIGRLVVAPESSSALVKKMIAAQTAGDAARLLEQGRFKASVEGGLREFHENGSLIRLETDLSRQLLRKLILLMHQHPLTVDVILGYMFAKEIEVRNLKLLLKAKQLGLGEGFIEQQIITM